MSKKIYPSIFIDTSAWVALNEKKDTYHKKAKLFIEKIKDSELNFGPIHTSDFVLQETFTYLLYNYNYKAAIDIVNRIQQSNVIIHPFNSLQFNMVWMKIEFEENDLSFVDWTTIIYMEKYNIKHIFSFDSDFSKFGFQRYP
jgi:predicted nucleic acid-binding protein